MRHGRHLALALALVAAPAFGQQGNNPSEATPSLNCESGPVEKTIGGTEWWVYACDDGRSVVLTAAPGSPAMPFHFVLGIQNDEVVLHGEGTGKREATQAAYDELSSKVLPDYMMALHAEATAAGKRPAPAAEPAPAD